MENKIFAFNKNIKFSCATYSNCHVYKAQSNLPHEQQNCTLLYYSDQVMMNTIWKAQLQLRIFDKHAESELLVLTFSKWQLF